MADDVHAEHLDIRNEHYKCAPMDVAFINSKGFGGNNATATVFSPNFTNKLLSKRYSEAQLNSYQAKLEQTKLAQADYQQAADNGQYELIYRFGNGMIDENELVLSQDSLSLPGFDKAVLLSTNNQYGDLSE